MSDAALRIIGIMKQAFGPMTKAALTVTLPLAALSFVCGLVLALIIALMRMSRFKVLNSIAKLYMTIVRGVPILVQLFIVFFGLPTIGIVFSPFASACICFTMAEGAYNSEVIRSAISAISKGQWEASKALGLGSFQTLRHIVLPQAGLIAVPSLANSFIGLTKTTSLAAVLTVTEIFHVGYKLVAVYYEPLWIYIETGVIYLALSSVLMIIQIQIEKKLGKHLEFLGV